MEQFIENKNNSYEKKPDLVDLYLMRIVERFFNVEKINNLTMVNAIITEAMSRYKASIIYEDKGVRALNGEEGIIVLSLRSLNIEPSFSKKTAFNKNFGTTTGTICEGDDLRLKNERAPLPHAHKFEDVLEAVNIIKEKNNKVESFKKHQHMNEDILKKISYSGETIDLIKIEQLENAITVKLNILNQKLAELKELETTYRVILDKNFAIIESGGNQ